MRKPLTPGRLVISAVIVAVVWFVVASILRAFASDDLTAIDVGWWIAAVLIVGLLLVALISKAVQIGVRSSRD